MADGTYQPKVYFKQHPTQPQEMVVASGGKIMVESGGEIEGLSGGFFDAQAGFDFYLAGDTSATYSANLLRNLTLPQLQQSIIANSNGAGSGVLSVTIFPSNVGLIILSMGSGASNASAQLHSAKQGQLLTIMTRGTASTASVWISVSVLGGAVLGHSYGSALSSISIQNSASQFPILVIYGSEDDVWSVIDVQARSAGGVGPVTIIERPA